MTRETEVHGWTVPTQGDNNYEAILSDLFDELDAHTFVRDTEANRTNYTPKADAVYFATDTETIYEGDGSSWVVTDIEVDFVTAERLIANTIESKDGSTTIDVDNLTTSGGGGVTDFEGLDDVSSGTLSNRPAAGTVGDWYFTTDNNGVYYDNGSSWVLIAEHPSNIGPSDLGFNVVTDSELSTHAGTTNAHHTRYSDSEALAAVNNDGDHGSTAQHDYFGGKPSNLAQEGASVDDHLEWNGSNWVPAAPPSGSGTSDHGDLSGLGDDDHSQYVLADGTRPLTSNWDIGDWDLTNVAELIATSATIGSGGGLELTEDGTVAQVNQSNGTDDLLISHSGDAKVTIKSGGVQVAEYNPIDVTTVISSPVQGMGAYHDGSGSLSEGYVVYDGSQWIDYIQTADIDFEIQDSGTSLGNFDTVNYATDLNVVDEGDKVAKVESTAASSSTNISAPRGTSDTIGVRSPESWLLHGYIVGTSPEDDDMVVIDPREYATDADAIQACNDTLDSNFAANSNHGLVRIPALRPDETQYKITKTVEIGSTNPDTIALQGYGFSWSTRTAIKVDTTVDGAAGDPAFRFISSGGNQSMTMPVGYLTLDAEGNNCEAMRFKRMSPKGGLTHMHLSDFRTSSNREASGVIVFDSGCFNFSVDYIHGNGPSFPDLSTAESDALEFFKMENTDNDDPPSEIWFRSGVNITGGFGSASNPEGYATAYHSNGVDKLSDIRWAGRVEGMCGSQNTPGMDVGAALYCDAGELYISDQMELSNNNKTGSTTTRHQVYFAGDYLQVADGLQGGDAPDDCIHISDSAGSSAQAAFIGDSPRYFGDGFCINCQESDPNGGNASINLPDRRTVVGGQGVNYPSGTNNVYERDVTEL